MSASGAVDTEITVAPVRSAGVCTPRIDPAEIEEALALARPGEALAQPHRDRSRHAPASRRARKAVARAWVRVLDRRSLRADLTFDEAGGDLLGLLRLIVTLERECGIDLPLAAFATDLCPSEMACVLDRCLQGLVDEADETGPAVFVLPPLSCLATLLEPFRRTCWPALRIEIVDPGDWPEMFEPGCDLLALAHRAAGHIAARAPSGPLLLAGYSYGGYLALEVAAALCQCGRKVAFVGILDTVTAPMGLDDPAPQPQPIHIDNVRRPPIRMTIGALQDRLENTMVGIVNHFVVQPCRYLLWLMGKLRQVPTWIRTGEVGRRLAAYIVSIVNRFVRMVSGMVNRLIAQARLTMLRLREQFRQARTDIGTSRFEHQLAELIVERFATRPRLLRLLAGLRRLWLPSGFGFRLNLLMGTRLRRDLLAAWRKRAERPLLPGTQIVLFRAEDTARTVTDETGWCAIYPGLRVVPVPGGHLSLVEPPHLATLCERFTEAALRATRRAP